MTADNIRVELLIKPSELKYILKFLDAFRMQKALDFKIVKEDKEEGQPFVEEGVFDGPPLTPEQLRAMADEAEIGEPIDYSHLLKSLDV